MSHLKKVKNEFDQYSKTLTSPEGLNQRVFGKILFNYLQDVMNFEFYNWLELIKKDLEKEASKED